MVACASTIDALLLELAADRTSDGAEDSFGAAVDVFDGEEVGASVTSAAEGEVDGTTADARFRAASNRSWMVSAKEDLMLKTNAMSNRHTFIVWKMYPKAVKATDQSQAPTLQLSVFV